MSWASSEVVGILQFLLPGFVAAAIFYSLTSHPKPGAFERIVQALIFTMIVQAVIVAISIGIDSSVIHEWEPGPSVLIAVVLALLATYLSNNDTAHWIFRKLRVTKETSYPTEWYSAFSRHEGCYVVLHMDGQRRLYGWPEEWPSRPDEGHFRISEGEWLTEEGSQPMEGVSAIVVPATEVEMVEFMDEHSEPDDE